jgi:McrBC 5-methylcytosine restriction system component
MWPRVLRTAEWLSEVTLRPLTWQLYSDVRVTRLNAYYGPALRLCRLYLEGRGVEQPTGEVAAPAFLLPMAQVFESAVAADLTQRLSNVKIQPRSGGRQDALEGGDTERRSSGHGAAARFGGSSRRGRLWRWTKNKSVRSSTTITSNGVRLGERKRSHS